MPKKVFFSLRFRFFIGCIASVGLTSGMLILPALPSIAEDFGNRNIALWMMPLFMIGASLGNLFWGPLSDRWGRAFPLYGGLLLTLIASCLSLYATSPTIMLGSRFFLGLGSCAGNTLARAICRDCYKGPMLEKMVGWVFTVIPLASAISPLVGSLIQSTFGWRACFLALSIFLGILLACSFFFLRLLPLRATEFSFRKMLNEYYFILSSSQNLWILLAISSGFIGISLFMTVFPHFVNQFYTGRMIPVLFFFFPLGVFLGGFYQSTWGSQSSQSARLKRCWLMITGALAFSLALLFLQGTCLLTYTLFMMVFGAGVGLFGALGNAFLMSRHGPNIAGTLSSSIGFFQTFFSTLGSFLAFFTPTPLVSLFFICASTFYGFLCYKRVQWN